MRKLILLSLVFMLPLYSSVVAIAPDDKEAVLQNHPFYDPSSTGGVCTGGSFNISGSSNLGIIWNYFRNKNFTEEQTAGIIGNLLKETKSTLDPRIKQGEGIQLMTSPYDSDTSEGQGRGIAQWSFNQRWQVLLDFAEAQGRDPINGEEGLLLQLDFIMFEMTGEPPVEGVPGGRWPRAYEEFQAMTSTGEQAVEEASVIFQSYYEVNGTYLAWRDGNMSYEDAFRERIDNGLTVYADMAGTGITGITCGPGGGISFDIVEGDTTDIPCQGNILGDQVATGYDGGVAYNIRICEVALPGGGAGPWVNSQISGAVSQMFESAYVAGVNMDGGGFRTMESQIQARIRNGCPDIYNSPSGSCDIETARPGYSNHQMGFAIDFNGVPKCPSEVVINGEDFCQAPGNTTWEWLTKYANQFGLFQFYREAWHWSIDGR